MNDVLIGVKFYAQPEAQLDRDATIRVFHRWIQQKVLVELALDVVDYSHVVRGPGVLLVAHEAHYGLDASDGRLGLSYTRKRAIPGVGFEQALSDALRAGLSACVRLEKEEDFKPTLCFSLEEVKVLDQRRLHAPNIKEIFDARATALTRVFQRLGGPADVGLEQASDPREPWTVRVRPPTPAALPAALQRLVA